MKNFIWNVFFGRGNRSSGLLSIGAISLIVLGCTCGKSFDLGNLASNSSSDRPASNSTSPAATDDDSLPAESVIQSLARETTTEFAQAIKTGDFGEIYENSSSDFQMSYTEQQMKDAFKVFTDQRGRVVPILERAIAMTADFSPAPYIRTEKGLSILVVNGKYATKPLPVNIEYEYVYRGGEWKMLKLIVKIQ